MPSVPPPLRVAVLARSVFPLHGFGGLERHTGDLVRHLRKAGLAVELITRPPTGSWHDEALHATATHFVPYVTFPFAGRRGTTVVDRSTAYLLFGLRAGRLAAGLVRAGRVDVVYGLGASALGYARARARGGVHAPFVFNPQGLEEFGAAGARGALGPAKRLGYAPLRAAVRACARQADCVIATDRSLEPTVRHALGVEPARIRVVPNAVDLEACDRPIPPGAAASLRRRAGAAEGQPLLLSVGRIERNKGFDVLARALARMRSADWRWVIVGEGPFRPRLESLIRELGVADRTLLAGRVQDDELHAWYEAATLFVHPTLYEGSSLVTLEAMAHRRAVVATRAGGLPDKVFDGRNGWLVDPGAAEPLAAVLQSAMTEPARLRQMGAVSRQIVESTFAWTVVAASLVELFREMQARGGLSPALRRTDR
jgi:glycosyltransferase involved in cell wall biosynthesis